MQTRDAEKLEEQHVILSRRIDELEKRLNGLHERLQAHLKEHEKNAGSKQARRKDS